MRRWAAVSSWSSCSATIARITSRSIRKYSCAIRLRSPHDLRPRDLRRASPRLVRDLCCCLADHDEVVENGVARLPIERAGSDVTANGRDRVPDVAEAHDLAPTHSGTASARAASRTSSRSIRGVATSTRARTSSDNSSERPSAVRSSAPAEPPSGSSTRRSMSLCGSSSPRASEPNTRMSRAPRAARRERILDRCSRSTCRGEGLGSEVVTASNVRSPVRRLVTAGTEPRRTSPTPGAAPRRSRPPCSARAAPRA
jgi:hypothetical protein